MDPQEQPPFDSPAPASPLDPAPAPAFGLDDSVDSVEPAPPDEPERPKSKRTRSIIEWVVVILVAITIAGLLRTFVVQTFWIPSGSMIPTLQLNDRVIVNKLSYRLHGVHRGDIVVFTTPPGVSKSFKDLVKRVVGLPGETVQSTNGHVMINGKELKESYLPAGTSTSDFGPVKIPPSSYWVMGDNRSQSADSRVFGSILKKTIVGRAFLRIWPLNRIGLL